MNVIEVRGVTKRFGEGSTATHALRGVSLDVREHEVLFLTGPSGSGKTTLVSILGGVLNATEGSVRAFGRDVTRLSESELAAFRLDKVGFIFQGANLIASLSALHNVRLPLLLAGVPVREANRRAAEALGRVGLAVKTASLPRELSGGQNQRVAIARAIVGTPPILLADEPTASLDAEAGRDVMNLLVGLAREHGSTVLVVTHDNRIFEFADRILSIEDGRIQRTEVAA